jgi:hypothetical protein
VVDRVKTDRTVPLQIPVRTHLGIFWDFSDSLGIRILGSSLARSCLAPAFLCTVPGRLCPASMP